MSPDLSAIFAMRQSTGRKLVLIAMIHRARGGWYRESLPCLVHDAQVSSANIRFMINALERAGLIHADPDNMPSGMIKAWRIDPSLTLEGKDVAT